MNQLASRGFTGPSTAIDGRLGILEVFGGESARPECLTEGLGERWAVDNNNNAAPSDTMEAQYSIPYCVAVALTGDPCDPAAFAPRAIEAGTWRAIAERVELHVDPRSEEAYPAHFGCRVQLHLDSGEVREAALLDAHGTVADPCTADERIAKFRRLASFVLSSRKSQNFVNALSGLERAGSTRTLTKLLAPTRHR